VDSRRCPNRRLSSAIHRPAITWSTHFDLSVDARCGWRGTLGINRISRLRGKGHVPFVLDPRHRSGPWAMLRKKALSLAIVSPKKLFQSTSCQPLQRFHETLRDMSSISHVYCNGDTRHPTDPTGCQTCRTPLCNAFAPTPLAPDSLSIFTMST
jgi:hypothetical protein